MVISDKSSKFIVFKYNIYQTFTAMFTESKITEIYCLADDFCKEFTKQQEKYMLEDKVEGHKHRNKPNRMSDSELMVILILFSFGWFPLLQTLLSGICMQAFIPLVPGSRLL